MKTGGLRGAAYHWLETNVKGKNESVVSIHANFIKGNDGKMKALMKHQLWLPTQDAERRYTMMCRPFHPPF
jgi:hypothetical protein